MYDLMSNTPDTFPSALYNKCILTSAELCSAEKTGQWLS